MCTEIITNYLVVELKKSERIAENNIVEFNRHPDIKKEFASWILERRFPQAAIEVQEYSAEKLCATTYLSPLGAYNFLIFLREDPIAALQDLKAGLPRK